jgi:hypothetical protein
MSTPRDRDGDGFDDGRADGPSGWHEPTHLGGGPDTPDVPGTPAGPAGRTGSTAAGGGTGSEARAETWQPPGWDLPAVEPDRPAAATEQPTAPPGRPPWQPRVEEPQPDVPPAGGQRRGLGGLFGSRSRSDDPSAPDRPVDQPVGETGFPPADPRVRVPPADPWGTQAWALSVGWVLSDGSAPEDEPLTALVQSAPVRPGKEDRAGRVLRGRGNGLDLVAFDIVSPVGRGAAVSTHAVTAAPVLGTVPTFRLSPARMWRHGTGGLVQVPSPDPEFDVRWVLLAAEDGPQLRRVAGDPVVRQLLLGSDDGDELWSAAGFVAAVRPDPNRPQLIEHHARILAAVVAALAAA